MKSLNLSLTKTVGFTVSAETFTQAETGKINFEVKPAVDADFKQARMNAAEVITGTIQLEQDISHFIGDVLCGRADVCINPLLKQRNFLGQHLLESKYLSFDARRALLGELIKEFEFVSSEKRRALVSRVKKIGMYRNAFAHGKMKHHEDHGITLGYHANGRQFDQLNDEFWDGLEQLFRETKEQLEFVEEQYLKSQYFKMWLPAQPIRE